MIPSLYRHYFPEGNTNLVQPKATCTESRSAPERQRGSHKVLPGAAELQIMSYKLYEMEKTLQVCLNYKEGERGG